MSDLFGASDSFKSADSPLASSVDSDLQQFLLVEREKAKLQAQVSI
jgi:hypothetical protein